MNDKTISRSNEEQAARRRRAERKVAKKTAANNREVLLEQRHGFVDAKALSQAMSAFLKQSTQALSTPSPMAFPSSDTRRWVPIGPSAVRRGQAEGSPSVSGRVRDLAVSPNGTRAYAATGKGGVWYTGDGGATWEPLGGWASEPRVFGGNTSAFTCGCLLVDFGATATNDFVMVGTGEIGAWQRSTNHASMPGTGVLVATAPGIQMVNTDPWESATGVLPPDGTGAVQANSLEGVSIVRMVRVPGSNAGQNNDRVIAATTGGLFLGTRTVGGGNAGFAWTALAAPPAPVLPSRVANAGHPTDLLYIGSRLFVCYRDSGLAVSDNNGGAFRWVTLTLPGGSPAASMLIGRMSLAASEYHDAVYLLGEINTTPPPSNATLIPLVWRIANPSVAAPAVPSGSPMTGVPSNANLWPDQRDYDQAITVITRPAPAPFVPPAIPARPAGAVDRVYIGGSLILVINWNASIWALDVAGNNLTPAPGISQAGDGANPAGLIGNAIHPDVHALRSASNADGSRQLWVACDGGVFVSLREGQTNTFASRNVGLASIEVGFVASHPSSTQFAMLGCQDNGRQVRVGESVWEVKATMQGDGGGVAIHPVQSHIVLGQFLQGNWVADPASRFTRPIIRPATGTDPENGRSSFYSGISTIRRSTGTGVRVAIGTDRIWVTDDLDGISTNSWYVLPFTPPPIPPATVPVPAPVRDPRPASRLAGSVANQRFGVPPNPPTLPGPFGPVRTIKWVNPSTLLALYSNGVIRYNELTPGNWTSIVVVGPATPAAVAPLVTPAATFFTDICPVPGGNDFYLSCTGQLNEWTPADLAAGNPAVVPSPALDSCFYFDAVAGGFTTTGLGQTLPTVPPALASPIDPAYSVIVDSTNSNVVYVGTVTGVWTSTKNPATNSHSPWSLLVNGLPESAVQDLTMWSDPAGAPGSPRLLRAALQSRGVWEVNLAGAAVEAVRTYLRVHSFDDRRMFPTPMKNPRRRPTAPDQSALSSPDITVRPRTPVLNTPSFRNTNLTNGRFVYQLWTFQTAFRWIYPSVIPDGRWTDQFAELVQRHPRPAGQTARRRVDANLWNQIMSTAVDENGNPGVYRAPWQNALSPNQPGTELDLMDSVKPRRDSHQIWQMYAEPSTIDVLLHHRDTRPVPANQSAAVLLWATARSGNALTALDCSGIPAYAQSLFTATPLSPPAGWNVQLASDGTALHRLSVPLAARMPRSVEIDLDLSAIPEGHRVMLLALSGSTTDPFSATTAGALGSVDSLVRNWPHAAARLISCWPRPGTALH